jgi:hypothetical protein
MLEATPQVVKTGWVIYTVFPLGELSFDDFHLTQQSLFSFRGGMDVRKARPLDPQDVARTQND